MLAARLRSFFRVESSVLLTGACLHFCSGQAAGGPGGESDDANRGMAAIIRTAAASVTLASVVFI